MLKKLAENWICSVNPPSKAQRATRNYLLIALIGISLVGCGSDEIMVRKGEILDSPYEIVINYQGIPAGVASDLVDQAEKKLEERYNMTAYTSDFIEDLNEDRSVPAPADFEHVAAFAETIRNATEGFYDYRQGGVRELWKLYNRKPKPPAPAELATALADAQSTVLEVRNGTATVSGRGIIDFGMLAEGSAVDYAAGVLLGGGIPKGRVSLGRVSRSWGGENEQKFLWETVLPPLPGDSMFKVITPPDGSIAFNHPSLNCFELNDRQRTRLLDPFTGQLSDSAIVAVGWAEEAAVAGAYAEAFFVMGRRNVFTWIERHQPAGAYLIYKNQSDGMILGETDAHLAECVSDSLPFER